MRNKTKSLLIDFLQISSLLILVLTGPLFSFSLFIIIFQILALALIILLSVNFILKIHYEENLLLWHFPSYLEYKKKSYRLIPFVY